MVYETVQTQISDCSWKNSLIRVYTVCHSTKYLKKHPCIQSKIYAKTVWNIVFKVSEHLGSETWLSFNNYKISYFDSDYDHELP